MKIKINDKIKESTYIMPIKSKELVIISKEQVLEEIKKIEGIFIIKLQFDATGKIFIIYNEARSIAIEGKITKTIQKVLPVPYRPCKGYFKVQFVEDPDRGEMFLDVLERLDLKEELSMTW
jgi:hypothetical protein